VDKDSVKLDSDKSILTFQAKKGQSLDPDQLLEAIKKTRFHAKLNFLEIKVLGEVAVRDRETLLKVAGGAQAFVLESDPEAKPQVGEATPLQHLQTAVAKGEKAVRVTGRVQGWGGDFSNRTAADDAKTPSPPAKSGPAKLVVTGFESAKDTDEIELFPADNIKWRDGPASLPSGAMIAVLEGDPTQEGPFVFRVKLPDGYRIPPHTHPKTERVTVISGTFNIGMGDKFDEKAGKAMTAGTFGYWPAGMKHFVWTKGETVLQFHGTGPWTIQYLHPEDDPRNKK
jgi:quercetin dioxygenase-like cupin family protein